MSPLARPLLAPLTPLYRLAIDARAWRFEHGLKAVKRLGWPVVSVGNLSAGGAGKTPFTMALAKALLARKVAVDVLSRGYGRKKNTAARVDPSGSAEIFGDEPLLMAQAGLPVYVARQRSAAGLLAESEDARKKIHLLDDGFQHRQLHRDVDFVLLCREDLEDALLPAGNLRESLRALRRASVLVIPAEDAEIERSLQDLGWKGPVWKIWRRMQVPALEGPVVAFCGIARPEQFFLGLEQKGVSIVARRVFRDHRPYRAAELSELSGLAHAHGATLLTTEKDAVRIGALAHRLSVELRAIKLVTEIQDEGQRVDWLLAALRGSR